MVKTENNQSHSENIEVQDQKSQQLQSQSKVYIYSCVYVM